MYSNVLFDLDGTLTDPVEGITNSVSYALAKRGIVVNDKRTLKPFIGPPLADSFERFYGFSREEAMAAVEDYREYFRPHGIFENELYDGVPEMLAALKKQGKRIILATSKPEEFAVKILRHFDLEKYFDFVAGSAMDGSRARKADVIRYALDSCGISDLDTCIMVGDREHDILGAADVGIHSIGVLWGYGDMDELTGAGATHIACEVRDILSIVSH